MPVSATMASLATSAMEPPRDPMMSKNVKTGTEIMELGKMARVNQERACRNATLKIEKSVNEID